MDISETPLISSSDVQLPPLLTTGYSGVNVTEPFIGPEEQLIIFLKQKISLHLSSQPFTVIEIKDEFKPTQYLKNPRPLKTFIVEDLEKNHHLFVFDIANHQISK